MCTQDFWHHKVCIYNSYTFHKLKNLMQTQTQKKKQRKRIADVTHENVCKKFILMTYVIYNQSSISLLKRFILTTWICI